MTDTTAAIARPRDGGPPSKRLESVIATRPTRVTLFEDRAEVVRTARVPVGEGSSRVVLGGITPFVDDRSVQVAVRGEDEQDGVSVASARVLRRAILPEEYAEEEIAELERTARSARAELERAEQRVSAAGRRRQRIIGLFEQWCGGLEQVPRGGGETDLADWRTNYEKLDTASLEALTAWAEASHARTTARDEAERAEARLAARRGEQPRIDATIEVQLLREPELESAEADDVTHVELEVTYRTPQAMWRPEHLAHIEADGETLLASRELQPSADESRTTRERALTIRTFGVVWQRTGERWDDVELVLSTARPSQASSPPPVRDDRIHSRRKTAEEQRTVVLESRDQTVERTGVEGTRQVDEMPGVDDGGEPLSFTVPRRVSLPSNGEPTRVPVHEVKLDADVSRVLRPERAPVAHLRAEAVHKGDVPLLAGPVHVVRGDSLMGSAPMKFVGAGEPFELGFGPDDAIRVRRRSRTERDTTITGAQIVEVTVDLFLSNLSSTQREVVVTERIPVSEVDGLSIKLREAHGFTHDERDGFLRSTIELRPNGTEQLTVKFRVKASSKMVLPF